MHSQPVGWEKRKKEKKKPSANFVLEKEAINLFQKTHKREGKKRKEHTEEVIYLFHTTGGIKFLFYLIKKNQYTITFRMEWIALHRL